MQPEALQTPVALFVFKRPETTRQVFEAIAQVRPIKLLLVADGPRNDRHGEAEACLKVRDIVAQVDWPCEVYTNFADGNLGCQERVISGLDWVFSLVEEAIILEDDCLPDLSFFPFCQELLERYRGDDRVASITGTNLVEKYLNTDSSYYFSQLGGIWGWASWRSEWQRYDRYLKDWPKLKQEKMLSEIFGDSKAVAYWTEIFDAMHNRTGPNTWDYQWLYTRLKNNSLNIIPRTNLISNIGFGMDATHTAEIDSRLIQPRRAIEFPLRHPSSFVPSRSTDRYLQGLFTTSLVHRISRRLRQISDKCFKD
ncbi:glycosyltransferase family 2 protein [Tunturibacter empetritectus]|uniref:Hemolytic protein HlpA-like protein n=1 Tax=Tunturiibacter empetritectus TaxID=3069691 RepID=A0A7W8IJ01_9BACT|nr:glycosyltransferase family 2 protein [Edaphobacter lichenicola]MBB5317220.1 hypothetical protein [Edaphobacter lichenicola]